MLQSSEAYSGLGEEAKRHMPSLLCLATAPTTAYVFLRDHIGKQSQTRIKVRKSTLKLFPVVANKSEK